MKGRFFENNVKDMVLFCFCFDFLHPSQQFFSRLRTVLPGLNQYKAADKVSCART